MSDFAEQKKQELERRIGLLEESLSKLRSQLAVVEQEVQHEAIDHLESYTEAIDHKYQDLKEFSGSVVEELRELLNNK